MNNTEIIEFIKSEHANGQSHEEIVRSLLDAGWKKEDIDSAFNTLNQVTSEVLTNNTPKSVHNVVTEKDYPISVLWIFKAPILIILLSIIAIFFGYFFPFLLILLPVYLIGNPFIRNSFHYSTEDKFFLLKQGVLSKSVRNLPYGVIQNVVVKQDLFDRVFGIASLVVENAVQPGDVKSKQKSFQLDWGKTSAPNDIGSSGNKVSIPGLKKKDAEAFKTILLERMKEYEIDDSQSGL